ncbi:MAG: DUF3124 domain-containing protein [Magnetococcales bacterium]|nr:DUF3124 domain-containing protein [Magnetococcales bacterium]
MFRLAPTLLLLVALTLCQTVRAEEPRLSTGQTLYVPVYSHILHGNLDSDGIPSKLLLSSMLSIRNINAKHHLTITGVRYYDTSGKLLTNYLKEPVTLAPMGSLEYFVEHRERRGGPGANFVVDWKAPLAVNPPITESVNAYFFGNHTLAFSSRGEEILPVPETTP